MRPDKKEAKKEGIPQFLRRYAKRYGVDVSDIIRTQKQSKPRSEAMGVA